MLEYEGPLHRAVLSRTLWLILLGPLLGLLWQLLVVRPRVDRAHGEALRRELIRAGWAGAVGLLATAVALAAHAARLISLPQGQRALFDHVVSGTRLPGLESPLDLWLDGRSVVTCGVACAVACAAGVRLLRGRSFERTWPRWAWLQLALLGALLAFLGDGLITVVAGWSLAGGAGVWIAGWHDPRASVLAAAWAVVAGGAVVVGAALLFWGLAGSWEGSDYEVDPPSLAAVRVEGRPGEATLTLTGAPGALVFLDDARVAALHSPFVRAQVTPGAHVVRIAAGGQTDVTSRVVLAPGDDAVLVPVEPTLSLHAMRDALDLHDSHGEPVFRRALEARLAPGGVGVVAATLLAWLLAVGAMSAVHASLAAPTALAALSSGGSTAMLGPVLLLRADFLFPSAIHTGAVVVIAGCALLLGATWRALPYDGLPRWVAFATGAPAGLVCVALGLGGEAYALASIVLLGLGAAMLHLSQRRAALPLGGENPDASPLLTTPARLGDLLATMEHGVVGAVARTIAASTHALAWIVATADRHIVTSPAERLADGVLYVSRAATPILGVGPGRIAWWLLALAGLVALVHALWSGG
jgi:hypothetical protein